VDVASLTHSEALDAWRQATEQITDTDRNGVLTTEQICTDVLGKDSTEHQIRKTRRLIKQWLKQNKVEPIEVELTNIAGKNYVVTGYKLVGQINNE
jgi:hypothetical protein